MADRPRRRWWQSALTRLKAAAVAVWERIPRPIQAVCLFVRDVSVRFGHSGSNLTAAAIAFYGLVCLTPLGIIAVAALQYVAETREDAVAKLEEFLNQMSPTGATKILDEMDSLLSFPDPAVTGGLGVLALLWAATRLFETTARALNALWPDSRDRGFFGRQLVGFITMLAAGVGLTGYMVVASVAANLREWLTSAGVPEELEIVPFGMASVLIALPFAFLAFFLLYKLIPTRRVGHRAAAAGALAATIGLQLAQPIFAALVSRSTRPASLYGSLSSVVVLALWMYVAAQLLLFGAHVAAQVEGAAMVPMVGGRGPVDLREDRDQT